MLPPLTITKIINYNSFTYRVTYNEIWTFVNDFNQMKDAENWKEVESILLPIERIKKLNYLMGKKNKIYTNILYLKKNY